MSNKRIIAGDVGGTNTRILSGEWVDGEIRVDAIRRYSSQEFSGLSAIIEQFMVELNLTVSPAACCFAVAGPVHNGVAKITNLPWVVERKTLQTLFAIEPVELLNDFQAVTYGVSRLSADEMVGLQSGKEEEQGNRVFLGAGTGFGVSYQLWQEGRYVAHVCEAGHVAFAPTNELEADLLVWLMKRHEYVSVELLLSGSGLHRIYQFLAEKSKGSESKKINDLMQQQDPAEVITQYALSRTDELCVQTVDCFLHIYGAMCGNVALNYMARGGVYVAGGIAPRIKDLLLASNFMTAFRNKGAMQGLMNEFSVKLVMQPDVGLYGAAAYTEQWCAPYPPPVGCVPRTIKPVPNK
ncbi:MAG: glucokinase [Gammaproteobacteria bacterium]|nr:glucokinase [Gammaproteobacteria bacterium]